MRYFCTYFNRNYFTRGILLYESLKRNCAAFRLWVLCLDRESHEQLSQLKFPELTLITLDELEQDDTALRSVKTDRTPVEYYFTCTPSLPLYVLHNSQEVDLITYVDADLFFFLMSRHSLRKWEQIL